jgi:hypothetical protein
MKRLKNLVAVGVSLVSLFTMSTSISAYSPTDAANYAYNYAYSINNNYKYYDNADCTNFTSQCLVAGGYSMNDSWKNKKVILAWSVTSSFISATSQKSYLTSCGWGTVTKTYSNPATVPNYVSAKGNIIYYDWEGNGSVDHTAFVSSVGAGSTSAYTYVSQHTTDRRNTEWSLYDHLSPTYKITCKYTIMNIG